MNKHFNHLIIALAVAAASVPLAIAQTGLGAVASAPASLTLPGAAPEAGQPVRAMDAAAQYDALWQAVPSDAQQKL